jgi:hypothetical protein
MNAPVNQLTTHGAATGKQSNLARDGIRVTTSVSRRDESHRISVCALNCASPLACRWWPSTGRRRRCRWCSGMRGCWSGGSTCGGWAPTSWWQTSSMQVGVQPSVRTHGAHVWRAACGAFDCVVDQLLLENRMLVRKKESRRRLQTSGAYCIELPWFVHTYSVYKIGHHCVQEVRTHMTARCWLSTYRAAGRQLALPAGAREEECGAAGCRRRARCRHAVCHGRRGAALGGGWLRSVLHGQVQVPQAAHGKHHHGMTHVPCTHVRWAVRVGCKVPCAAAATTAGRNAALLLQPPANHNTAAAQAHKLMFAQVRQIVRGGPPGGRAPPGADAAEEGVRVRLRGAAPHPRPREHG